MEIAYVLSQNKGGLPHYAAQLANSVARHADVTVFKPEETSADDVFAETVRTVDAFRSMDLSLPDFYRFNVPVRRNLQGLYSYRHLKLIDRFEPDVVHDPTDLFPQVKFFSKLYGIDAEYPFVVTYHEVDDQRFAASRPVETAENVLDAAIPDLALDRVIVHANNQVPIAAGLHPETPVDVVPHGANDLFTTYDYDERPVERNTILFFGNIIPEKGIDTLVDAIPIVRRRVPDVTLLVAGDGRLPKRSRRVIERYADHFEIHDHFVPNERVGEFFSRAALVALPYRDRDGGEKGHSGVLSTAHSFGKPVVATDAGDFPDLVEGADCGLVVPPEDPRELADAIVSVLEDDDRRRRMGERSAERAASLSWDAIAEKHLDLYERVVDSR